MVGVFVEPIRSLSGYFELFESIPYLSLGKTEQTNLMTSQWAE